jgi:hypothetical protein
MEVVLEVRRDALAGEVIVVVRRHGKKGERICEEEGATEPIRAKAGNSPDGKRAGGI